MANTDDVDSLVASEVDIHADVTLKKISATKASFIETQDVSSQLSIANCFMYSRSSSEKKNNPVSMKSEELERHGILDVSSGQNLHSRWFLSMPAPAP